MQITTVISDSFVASAALYSLVNIFIKKSEVNDIIRFLPFFLMIIAACTGVLRFSFFPNLANLHEALSAIASHVGMFFLFVLFYSIFIKPFQYAAYLLLVLAALSAFSFYFNYTMIYTKITGTLAIIGILTVCGMQLKNQRNAAGIGMIACIFSMIAGAFQEFHITAGPFLSIDLFHFALSTAIVLWGVSLKKHGDNL